MYQKVNLELEKLNYVKKEHVSDKLLFKIYLTYFRLMFPFYTLWKRQIEGNIGLKWVNLICKKILNSLFLV